jgi:hypothetical protein
MKIYVADPDEQRRVRDLADSFESGIKSIRLFDGTRMTGLVVGSWHGNSPTPQGGWSVASTVTLYILGSGRRTLDLATQVLAVDEPPEDERARYEQFLERNGGSIPDE